MRSTFPGPEAADYPVIKSGFEWCADWNKLIPEQQMCKSTDSHWQLCPWGRTHRQSSGSVLHFMMPCLLNTIGKYQAWSRFCRLSLPLQRGNTVRRESEEKQTRSLVSSFIFFFFYKVNVILLLTDKRA